MYFQRFYTKEMGPFECSREVQRQILGFRRFCGANYSLLDIGVTLLQLSEFIEPFAEAESAPIRSAVKFYFDIDVRIFVQLFVYRSKKYFRSTKKKICQKI